MSAVAICWCASADDDENCRRLEQIYAVDGWCVVSVIEIVEPEFVRAEEVAAYQQAAERGIFGSTGMSERLSTGPLHNPAAEAPVTSALAALFEAFCESVRESGRVFVLACEQEIGRVVIEQQDATPVWQDEADATRWAVDWDAEFVPTAKPLSWFAEHLLELHREQLLVALCLPEHGLIMFHPIAVRDALLSAKVTN